MKTFIVYFFRPGATEISTQEVTGTKPSEAIAKISGPVDTTRSLGYFRGGK